MMKKLITLFLMLFIAHSFYGQGLSQYRYKEIERTENGKKVDLKDTMTLMWKSDEEVYIIKGGFQYDATVQGNDIYFSFGDYEWDADHNEIFFTNDSYSHTFRKDQIDQSAADYSVAQKELTGYNTLVPAIELSNMIGEWSVYKRENIGEMPSKVNHDQIIQKLVFMEEADGTILGVAYNQGKPKWQLGTFDNGKWSMFEKDPTDAAYLSLFKNENEEMIFEYDKVRYYLKKK